MCQCYAASSSNPFDECEEETDETCAIASCVNSCENSEAYCDNPQGDSGLCLLRPIETSISNDNGTLPACSSSFTIASCPVYAVPQNITITSITNDTACLQACIECQGPTWGCTAKFGKYSYMNKSIDDFTTTAYSYKCSCEVGPNCGNGSSENYTDLCMDVGYKSSSASKVSLIRRSMMFGVVSLYMLLL